MHIYIHMYTYRCIYIHIYIYVYIMYIYLQLALDLQEEATVLAKRGAETVAEPWRYPSSPLHRSAWGRRSRREGDRT